CLVCLGAGVFIGGGPLRGEARSRAARPRRGRRALCQYTRRPRRRQAGARPRARPGGPPLAGLPGGRDDALVVVAGGDGEGGQGEQPYGDGRAGGEGAELFQFFRLLQGVRRQRGQAEEEVAAVGVQPDVLQEARRAGGEVGAGVTDVGDRATAEIEGTAVV